MISSILATALITAAVPVSQATQPVTTAAAATQPLVEVAEEISYPNAGVHFNVPSGCVRRVGIRPTELFRGEKRISRDLRISIRVVCDHVGEMTVEQVGRQSVEDAEKYRRTVAQKHSGYVALGDKRFYEMSGTSSRGRRGELFLWRYVKRQDVCYGVLLGTPVVKGKDRGPELRQMSDAICGSLTFVEFEDPNQRLYDLSGPVPVARRRLNMALPEAWRWTGLARGDAAVMVGCGLKDYQRNVELPLMMVRMEYCPPGITAEQVVEGAYQVAAGELAQGQKIEKLRVTDSELIGGKAVEMILNAATDEPYTEARRSVRNESWMLSVIVRYAGLNNDLAGQMLERVAASCELIKQKPKAQPTTRRAPRLPKPRIEVRRGD